MKMFQAVCLERSLRASWIIAQVKGLVILAVMMYITMLMLLAESIRMGHHF